VMFIQREMNCYMKNILDNKDYQKLDQYKRDQIVEKEEEKIKKMKKKQQEDIIKSLELKAKKDYEKRNKFNELGH
jgi:hypothetical protein